MSDDIKLLRQLSDTSGVSGVERLIALYKKKYPDIAAAHSVSELRRFAKSALETKPDRQILQPPVKSGGGIHANSMNEVWQCDLASMATFGGSAFGFLCCVDVFSRMTRAVPLQRFTAEEVVKAFQTFGVYPKLLDCDENSAFKGAFETWANGKRSKLGARTQWT